MKKLLYLINYEMQRFLKLPLIISFLLILAQQVLMAIVSKNTYRYIPYEEFFASSSAVTIFFLAYASCCGICILSILSNYHGSKSIYTLMTLPHNRSRLYFSKLIFGSMVFLVLLSAQMISSLIGYVLFAPKIQRVIQETGPYGAQYVYEHAKNGLFLAFVRSGFFRLLYPLGLESFISSAAILFSFICGLYYGILCERSKKYIRIALVIAHLGYSIYILNHRYNAHLGFEQGQNLYIHSIIFTAFAGFFIWDSLRLIRKSTIS